MIYTQEMKDAGFQSYDDWETARYNAGVEYKNAPFNTAQDKANSALLYRRFHRLARMGDNA